MQKSGPATPAQDQTIEEQDRLSTAEFKQIESTIDDIFGAQQDVDVEESIHLVSRGRKERSDFLNILAAQNKSIKYAQINHLIQDVDAQDETLSREDPNEKPQDKVIVQTVEKRIDVQTDLPAEFQMARAQMKDHYEGQLKGLLEEIVKQKELLETTYSQKLAKEVQAKDTLISQIQQQLEVSTCQLEQSKQKITELVEQNQQMKSVLEDKDSLISKLNAKVEAASQEVNQIEQKLDAAFTYMSIVKQGNEGLTQENQKLRSELKELQNEDFTKHAQALKTENETLRQECRISVQALESLKQSLKHAIQNTTSSQSHFQTLLETQSTELVALRKLLGEIDQREKNCQRRWNLVIKENSQLNQSLQDSLIQAKKQKDQFQRVITINERYLADANNLLSMNQEGETKQQAAQFLVHQIRQLQDYQNQLLIDNQALACQVNELMQANMNANSETRSLDYSQLLNRTEQLEDVIMELQTKNSAQQLLELRNTIVRQAAEILELQQKLQVMQRERVRAADLFDGNELYATFQKVIKQRDQVIQDLVQQVQIFKENAPIAQPTKELVNAQTLDKPTTQAVNNFEAEAARLTQALNMFESAQLKQHQSVSGKTNLYGMSERDDWLIGDHQR